MINPPLTSQAGKRTIDLNEELKDSSRFEHESEFYDNVIEEPTEFVDDGLDGVIK